MGRAHRKVGHYDKPPPDRLSPDDLPQLQAEDRFREVNFFKAWAEVENGRTSTTAGLARRSSARRHSSSARSRLVQKAGTIDFKTWYRESHRERTPCGEEDASAVVTAAESELERRLSRQIMQGGAAPERKRLEAGETLVEQGARGDELYLLLDGVFAVEIDGEQVAEVGPARSSASWRSSRAGRGRRRSVRRRRSAWPWFRATPSTARRSRSWRRAAASRGRPAAHAA